MNINDQKIVTLVSDIKFTLTKLDPAKHQKLIDLLIECSNKLENTNGKLDSLINNSITEIEKCVSENNLNVPDEVAELVKLFSAFLPH